MGVVFFLGLLFLVPMLALGIASVIMDIQGVTIKGITLDKVNTIANVNIACGILSILGAVGLILYPFLLVIFGCGLAILIIGLLMKDEAKKQNTNIRVESILSIVLVAIEFIVPVAYFIINH